MMNLILASANPVGHVTDKPIYDQWYFSNVTFMLLLSAAVTAWLIIPAAKKIATGESRTLDDYRAQGAKANFVEVICLYLRDDVFRPMLEEETDKYMPMLWTFFWFILINNLLGLVPILDITALMGINTMTDAHGHQTAVGIGGTATQSIWVTATLAIIAFVFINGTAILKDPIGYCKHLTAGAPVFMWPIMVPVELIGKFVVPISLALRLFANMTGGHIIVATLLGFVASLSMWKVGVGHGLAILPLMGTMAIYLLELLVAFIQAYIFTFLTGLFLSQVVVHHDDHSHEGDAHAAH
jgi:F-type H+-transporting ATPase subunit a